MKKFLIYLSTFLILFGVSTAFAGVYIEDFEDGVLDPDWYVEGEYEIKEKNTGDKYLRMYHAIIPEPGGLPDSVVASPLIVDEFIYRIEADLLVPEERYQRLGMYYQWELCEDPAELICYGLQVFLGFGFQAEIGSFSTTGGHTHLGQVALEPANFGEWYHLSITLHDDHVTFGINGNETDLFHGLYYDPQSISYTYFHNYATVSGGDGGDERFVDVDYSIDNLVVYASPGTTIDDVLESVEDWIEGGELVGVGEGNSAAGRLNAFENMLQNARDLFYASDIEVACDQLMAASRKCDGQPRPPDFVEGDAAAELMEMIEALMSDFGCAE